MTKPDHTHTRVSNVLDAFSRWQRPDDEGPLTNDQCRLVQQLAEDRLMPGSESHGQAVQWVSRNREARALWTTLVEMEHDLEVHMLDAMEHSLDEFLRTHAAGVAAPSSQGIADEPVAPKPHSAQVADLVARLRRRGSGPEQAGALIERYAAETVFAPAGRGKYVADDMVMSLVFPSMDPQASPIGFLITCPVDVVQKKYAGQRFRVLFVEPESSMAGVLEHRVIEVGPFDSAGEIEARFEMAGGLDRCVVPVWIDGVG